MFGWLRRKPKAEPTQVEREIFVYWDGTRHRRIDPIAAQIALDRHEHYNQQTHPKMMDNGDVEAMEIAAAAVGDVFGIPELGDENGLTLTERIDVLIRFYQYMGGLKKKSSPSPMPSSPLAETFTRFTGQDPTSYLSESGQPSSEPKSAEQIELEPPSMRSSEPGLQGNRFRPASSRLHTTTPPEDKQNTTDTKP